MAWARLGCSYEARRYGGRFRRPVVAPRRRIVASDDRILPYLLSFGVIETHAVSLSPGTDLAGAPSDTRLWMLYLWAMLFSPISLWAPVVFGTLTYTLVTRLRSNNRWREQ
jgi:hypothetical protein